VGCWGDSNAGGTVSAASSSLTAIGRHRRRDRLLRAMDDPFDLSADAMLEDTEDLQLASAVAAHLQALRHWRKHARGSRVHRRPRYVGSGPGRRPNKRRNFRSGLRAILRDYFGLNGDPPVYFEGDFERRFRVPRSVFLRIYKAVKDRPFFCRASMRQAGSRLTPCKRWLRLSESLRMGRRRTGLMNMCDCPLQLLLCRCES